MFLMNEVLLYNIQRAYANLISEQDAGSRGRIGITYGRILSGQEPSLRSAYRGVPRS